MVGSNGKKIESGHVAYTIEGNNALNNTVNSEIFARVLFSGNFPSVKIRKNKILAK